MDPSLLSFAGPSSASASSSYRPQAYLNNQQQQHQAAQTQHPGVNHHSGYLSPKSPYSSVSPISSTDQQSVQQQQQQQQQQSQHQHNGSHGYEQRGAGGAGGGANDRDHGPWTGPLVSPHQDLQEFLEQFWMRQMDNVEREEHDGKGNVVLPLARIKKVMKSDEDVKMISAEVPIMFSKACEVFISELTCRAWLVAESHKRRTLQKSDVATAIAFSDMFDFLIDIVPREGDTKATSDGGDEQAEEAGDGDVEVGDDDAVDGAHRAGNGEQAGEGEEELYREFVEGEG